MKQPYLAEVLSSKDETKIRVVVKEPLKPAEIRLIDNDLSSMQQVVGGDIEVIPFPYNQMFDIYLNEEGKLNRLKPNLRLEHNGEMYDVVVGTVFISKVNEEGEAVSLELSECFQILTEIDKMAIQSVGEQNLFDNDLERIWA